MRAALVLGCLALAGCFSPKFSNGQLKCDTGAHPCPDGYHCAANNTCWQTGTSPTLDMAVRVTAMPDLALSALPDLATGSLADMPGADMAKPIKHQGQACAAGDTCDTGNCVDGYCCNSTCSNSCQACNVGGSLGFCINVGSGITPIGSRTCNAQAASTCGRDGTCDGQGNCRNWPSGTQCSAGTCNVATGAFVNPSTCNGTGACVPNPGGNCAPYNCQDTTQCYATCSGPAQCSSPNTCSGGSCGPLANGRKCTSGAQCSTGNCVDFYCCDKPCNGTASACQACDVAGSFGICTTVGAGPPHSETGPGSTSRSCTNQGMSPCGGTCNGNIAACSYAAITQPCGSTCVSGQLQQSFCDAAGTCAAKAAATCAGNYDCPTGGSTCVPSCASNADCYPAATYGCNPTKQCANFCVFDVDSYDDGCIYEP